MSNSSRSKTIHIRFYEELNDFLPGHRRKVSFDYTFVGELDIQEIIHMIGVPHPEVDLIVVNDESVDFHYRPQAGDRIAVYPVFESIDITPINYLRPKPLRKIKFILDIHLGRLTKYLRICGFDCYYENLDDSEIIEQALSQHRIILTKDRGLLKNKKVTHGYWVRTTSPLKQLLEIIDRFDLTHKINFLTRCLLCNAKIQKISKQQILHLLPKNTENYYDVFYICHHCNKIYWEGSHYKNMAKLIDIVKTRY